VFNADFNSYGHITAVSAPTMLSWLSHTSTYTTPFHEIANSVDTYPIHTLNKDDVEIIVRKGEIAHHDEQFLLFQQRFLKWFATKFVKYGNSPI